MASEKELVKITRVHLIKERVKGRKEKFYEYRAWHGCYQEDAKTHRVYLGRALPERFEHLKKKKPDDRGRKNFKRTEISGGAGW